MISEIKLDSTFPNGQFQINGYHSPYREDRNAKGGGLLLYVCEHIPCRRLRDVSDCSNNEAIFIELNLRKLLIGKYNPHKYMIGNHLDILGKQLNDVYGKYDNIILVGDFNAETSEDDMKLFCTSYNLKNLVKKPACFKNIDNPSCIDLILTNKPLSFPNTMAIETGLSDFHYHYEMQEITNILTMKVL